jgi:hypothetical protein
MTCGRRRATSGCEHVDRASSSPSEMDDWLSEEILRGRPRMRITLFSIFCLNPSLVAPGNACVAVEWIGPWRPGLVDMGRLLQSFSVDLFQCANASEVHWFFFFASVFAPRRYGALPIMDLVSCFTCFLLM